MQYSRSRASKQPILPDLSTKPITYDYDYEKCRFSYSLFVSYYFLVLKVIKLLLFGPSRSINCIDGLLIEKDNIILTTFIEKIEWYLLKIRFNVY